MSNNNSGGRKVPARIVRIGATEPTPPNRKLEGERESAPRPGQRVRAFGAPLTASTRATRSTQQAAKNDFAQVMADMPSGVMSGVIPQNSSASEEPGKLTHADNSQHELPPGYIWERSFPLELSPQEDVPRWVANAELIPTAEEFEALGAYVTFMIDGFVGFCRMPSVEESGNWHARLKMPQVVMPDTMLDVSLSPLHIRLRFETNHRVSKELLSRNSDRLQAQVIAALEDSREVEVIVW